MCIICTSGGMLCGAGKGHKMQQNAVDDNDRLYYRPKEVARLLGIGLRTVYKYIYSGHIPSRKIGNTRLVPAAALVELGKASDSQQNQYSPANSPSYPAPHVAFLPMPYLRLLHTPLPARADSVQFLHDRTRGSHPVLSSNPRPRAPLHVLHTHPLVGNCPPSLVTSDQTALFRSTPCRSSLPYDPPRPRPRMKNVSSRRSSMDGSAAA